MLAVILVLGVIVAAALSVAVEAARARGSRMVVTFDPCVWGAVRPETWESSATVHVSYEAIP